jgi:hypothetical protein
MAQPLRHTTKPKDPYRVVRVKVPAFALLVLQRRARKAHQTLSNVLETMIWNDVYLDEVQDITRASPAAASAFATWFRCAVRKKYPSSGE